MKRVPSTAEMASLPKRFLFLHELTIIRMNAFGTHSLPGFFEPVSCFTHLFAAPVFAVIGWFLLQKSRGSWARSISLAVMVVTTVFLLSMSGIYHLLEEGSARTIMMQLDVAGVFTLIAGTATPVHAILFTGLKRWLPLLIVWVSAAVGITLRIVFWNSFPSWVGIAIFLVMGWGGAASCLLLWRRFGYSFIEPLFMGGLAYTIGAIILGLHWPNVIPGIIGPHELWHVAVLVGLSLHWAFVFEFAAGALNGVPSTTQTIATDSSTIPSGRQATSFRS